MHHLTDHTAAQGATASPVEGYAQCSVVTEQFGDALALGDFCVAVMLGNDGTAIAANDYGAAIASGSNCEVAATSTGSVAVALGYDCRARASEGSALVVIERNDDWDILSIACGIVGKNGILADHYYVCKAGLLVLDQ
jgi:hypothetical protein